MFEFKTEESDKIINRFGNEFYSRLWTLMEVTIVKWQIVELELVNSFSSSLVFKGISEVHGPVLMKFGVDHLEFLSEVHALKYFGGRGFCRLIDVDVENSILLEELITPGQELKLEELMEKRLEIFIDLYKKLHGSTESQRFDENLHTREFSHKSYKDWIFRITDYMDQKNEWLEIALHMKKAKEIYMELTQEYADETLLHGDLHYYNILKGKEGYQIIDPKGVIGNPIFDIPRYVLNEYYDESDRTIVDEKIGKLFSILSEQLMLPKKVLSKLLYIEGALAICWNIESGSEKPEFLNTLNHLTQYINLYEENLK